MTAELVLAFWTGLLLGAYLHLLLVLVLVHIFTKD